MQINEEIIKKLQLGDTQLLAKCITCVENQLEGSDYLLKNIQANTQSKLIGITGAPGAGKSTLINALLATLTQQQKKVAVLSIDPSSPFNYGALLGDRIRMAAYYTNPLVYIRSLASRGSLGGLHPRILEICDVVKAANFDYILLETVGVGQSEVEIAGIADTTIVVVVPEGGDEIQTMKAGVMEIADIFVVNKADRSTASTYIKNLQSLSHSKALADWQIPVVKCIATQEIGITELLSQIEAHHAFAQSNRPKKDILQLQKILQLIQQHRMQNINIKELQAAFAIAQNQADFNVYRFAEKWY